MSLPKLPNLPRLGELKALTKPSIAAFKPPDMLRNAQPQQLDPLAEVNYTGNFEEDAKTEMSATLAAFMARRTAEAKRFELATDTEYWFCVCFQTREQKDHFLQAVEWFIHGDKYLDGAFVAAKMGVELPPAEVPYNTSAKVDAKLKTLTE
jgi:hypothetical protein